MENDIVSTRSGNIITCENLRDGPRCFGIPYWIVVSERFGYKYLDEINGGVI